MPAPVILIEARPRRVADGVEEIVRLAGGGASSPYLYDGEHWRAGVAGLPTIITSIDFSGDDLGTGGVPQAVQLRWAPASSADLALQAAYFWTDAALTIRIGPEGTSPPVVLTGRVLDATVDSGALVIAMADPAADLKVTVLTDRFGGTGGIDGPAEWEGQIKRRAWGRVFNIKGEPIDQANDVYCFGDPNRSWEAIDAVRDKGAAAAELVTVAWQGSAEATFAALQAAEAPQGGGAVAPSIACVKWWTTPAGDLCADVRGENAGGYVETAPEIAQRVVAARSAIAFAAGTVVAAAAARPGAAGVLADDETQLVSQVLDDLLGGVSLSWVLDEDGTIELRQWSWGPSAASVVSAQVNRRQTFKPVGTRTIGYRANQNVMARGDIAGIVLVSDIAGLGAGATANDLAELDPGAADELQQALTAAQAAGQLAAGKTTIFYQSVPPSASASQPNDQWINTSAGNLSLVRVAGSGLLAIGAALITFGGAYLEMPWAEAPDQRIDQALIAAAGAQATADGKVTTFNQEATPTATGIGDLWYQPSTKTLSRWSGLAWAAVSTYGATSAEAASITASERAIATIADDNVLSKGEKPQFVREWQEAEARYAAIDAKAATFANVAAQRAALTAAYTALSNAIGAITPAYDDTSADSPISGDTLQADWNGFYTAYAALDMTLTAQTLTVQWSVDGATNWHDDPAAGDKWIRQSVDGGATWSAAVKVVGEDGAQGPQGIPGTPGADGITHYTWVAYADSADGTVNFTTGAPGTRAYLGLAPNKTTAVESANPADYTWSKIVGPQGAQGAQGAQGIQGPPGADGTPRYIWIAYADSADGTVNFTNGDPGARSYIGVASNKTVQAESANPADYSWAKITGPQGAAGADGVDGQHTSFAFIRAAAQPATPTDAVTPPAGWSDAPPAQTDPATPLWMTQADFRNAAKLTAWSTPVKLIASSLEDLDPDAAALLSEAMNVASGKNTIFRQATPPAAAASQPNDIWVNTAAGNRTMQRVAGSGLLAISGNAITFNGNHLDLAWIEAPDAQLGQALTQIAAVVAQATAAQATADDAVASIEDLGDDGQLTPVEKQSLIQRDASLDGAWGVLDAQAATFGVTTERTAASTARSAWIGYRNGLSPAWNDTSSTTPVSRTTLRATLTTYDTALTTLQKAISAAAALRAEYDLVSGSKPPANADNTAENQVHVTPPTNLSVAADYTGTPTAGQLPLTAAVQVARGSTDITTDDATSYAVSNIAGTLGSVTINNTNGDPNKGLITINNVTGKGQFDLIVTVNGMPQPTITIQVDFKIGAPPSGGGGSSTSASQDLTGFGASGSSFRNIYTFSAITVGAGKTLSGHITSSYDRVDTSSPLGSQVELKWQYAPAGTTSWTDMGAAVTGTTAIYDPRGISTRTGSVTCNQSATPAAGSYDVRLAGMTDNGKMCVFDDGLASVSVA